MSLVELVLDIVRKIIAGRSDEEVAKALIDAAFESGVPATVLSRHLTQRAAADEDEVPEEHHH